MDINYFLNYLYDSLQEMTSDVKKLYSNNCNKSRILDDLCRELTTLTKYTNRFRTHENNYIIERNLQNNNSKLPRARPVMSSNVVTQPPRNNNNMDNSRQVPERDYHNMESSQRPPQMNNNMGNQMLPQMNNNMNNQMPPQMNNNIITQPKDQSGVVARTFTEEELAEFNGQNGKPAYVAVNGTVYDVTDNRVWATKIHFGLLPGKNLTSAFDSCHPGANVLDNLTKVGVLV